MTPPSQINYDVLCFAHLRWNFVFQRPQHLMSRFARERRVFYFEEPIFDAPSSFNNIVEDESTGVTVITPHIPSSTENPVDEQRKLLQIFLKSVNCTNYILWYYTPLAFMHSNQLQPLLTVYDCMDELSLFKFASPDLKEWEIKLFTQADIVFTGGRYLYEAKKQLHKNIHPFPSGIDITHFEKARIVENEPHDQSAIPKPRIGFFGVVDERFNVPLLKELATEKPDWHFIIIGPMAKIDAAILPKNNNIHFLGMKNYNELPHYLAGWDIAFMPFELNDATRYISPTKILEFLAGGKPVVSTSVHDVVVPYAEDGLVHIADTPAEFISAIEHLLENKESEDWLKKVDIMLSAKTWDSIWHRMNALIKKCIEDKKINNSNKYQAYV